MATALTEIPLISTWSSIPITIDVYKRQGHYENRKESVDLMIRKSREIIDDLIGFGVDFEQEDGCLKYTREGAHSCPRILFHKDITGKEITSKLLERVKERKNVTIFEYTTMTDILEEDGKCTGILAENEQGTLHILSLIHI